MRLDGVVVTGTQPTSTTSPLPPIGGGGGGGFGGCDSDCYENEPNIPDHYCEDLAARKPPDCPNPIPRPSGPRYAEFQLASGTAVRKAIAFTISSAAAPQAQDRVSRALTEQTERMSHYWESRSSVNAKFADEIRLACETQVAWSQLNDSLGVIPIEGTRQCADLYNRVLAEASETDFGAFFKNWLDLHGIDLTDLPYIGNTLINQATMNNSLARKRDIVEKDLKCAMWWQDVQGVCENP